MFLDLVFLKKKHTLFVKGEESLFPELVHNDDQYNMLVQPNEEIDPSTIQSLELIFGPFLVVSNRILKDHLKGRKYATFKGPNDRGKININHQSRN